MNFDRGRCLIRNERYRIFIFAYRSQITSILILHPKFFDICRFTLVKIIGISLWFLHKYNFLFYNSLLFWAVVDILNFWISASLVRSKLIGTFAVSLQIKPLLIETLKVDIWFVIQLIFIKVKISIFARYIHFI